MCVYSQKVKEAVPFFCTFVDSSKPLEKRSRKQQPINTQNNEWVMEASEAMHDVNVNPDKFEGNTIPMKMMHSKRMRTAMSAIHNRRCWLRYAAASLRYFNLKNMAAIGISEQEVMEYTAIRLKGIDNVGTRPDASTFYTKAYTLDSHTSLTHLTKRIEELKAEAPLNP